MLVLRVSTPQERVISGLRGKGPHIQMDICQIPGKGRGVFVDESVGAGMYLCEYKSTEVYPRSEKHLREFEYRQNNKPCMVLEVEFSSGWFCLDAKEIWNTWQASQPCSPKLATAKPFNHCY